VNGSQGFYDLDSEATCASVSSFHGLLICLRSVNARIDEENDIVMDTCILLPVQKPTD